MQGTLFGFILRSKGNNTSKVIGNTRFDLLRFHFPAAFGECDHCLKQSPALYDWNDFFLENTPQENREVCGGSPVGLALPSQQREGQGAREMSKRFMPT